MTRSFSVALLSLTLLACNRTDSVIVNSGIGGSLDALDINAAASEAQGDIDTYAANSLENQPTPAPAPIPPPRTAPSPEPGEAGGLPGDRTAVSEAPVAPESAQGAARVVQSYYALIEAGKYREAWARWRDAGKASGMSLEDFASSFAKYKEYHATIGAPGRIHAGAGQRYVDVPVQIYGTLLEHGRPFDMRGTVTLHRTADIPGATGGDKSWHIERVDIKPRP